MKQFVWILAASYVVFGAGLFYGLAIGSTTLSLAAGALLALLAVPQWIVLSRGDRRTREPGRVPRGRI